MVDRRHLCVTAAVGAALLAGAARSQTEPPAPPATTPVVAPPETQTRPALKTPQPQPAAFLELAEKARKIKAVYIKGRGTVDGDDSRLPPEMREFGFEIWARPPAAKTRLVVPSGEERLCDGKTVYIFRHKPGQAPQGRRRKVTATNFYHAVGLAAVVVDAAAGYANLARSVRFVAIPEEARHAKKFPALKWFRLKPGPGTDHHLLRGTTDVKVGLSAKDGLVRVVIGRLEIRTKQADGSWKVFRPTSSVFFESVRHERIEDEVFKLPPSAAEAKWVDGDTNKSVPVPKEVIAAKKS